MNSSLVCFKQKLLPIFLALVVISLLASCYTLERKVDSNTDWHSNIIAVDFEQFSPEEKLIVKFSHVVAESTPKGLAALQFKRLVEERSNGQIEVQIFPNAQLYDDDAVISALQQGHVQLIAPATSKMTSLIPEWQVFDLPFAFTDEFDVQFAMDGKLGQLMFSLLENHNMHGLAMWDNGFKQLTSRDRVIARPDDLNGLRMRVMESKVLETQFAQLGAIPVAARFSDVYSLLEQGLVDGQENTLSNIYSKKFYEQQAYLTITNHGYLGYAVITNNEYWQSLPPEQRIIMEEALADATDWIRVNAPTINERQLQNMKRISNINVYYPTAAELDMWRASLDPVYSWLESEIGNIYLDALDK